MAEEKNAPNQSENPSLLSRVRGLLKEREAELESLKRSKEELEEAKQSLEIKVKERTAELQKLATSLEGQVKERTREVREKMEQLEREAKELENSRKALMNILEDIEEARRAQEAEKNKVEAVIRSLTDGLIMVDQFGWVSLLNDEAQKTLGIQKGDILGKRLSEAPTAEAKKISQLIEIEKGQLDKREIALGGSGERVLEISTAPVVGFDKKTLGQIIILHDVTREKAIERMKSEFVTIAAHQLRTPLSAVKWTLRLVLDGDMGPVSKEQAEILQKGYQSNERMINLVNDLLNVARIEEGRFIFGFAEVSFADLVKETIESFQATLKMKNITIKFEKPKGEKITALVDKEKIKLALQNLIENAINYSPAGSTVTILLSCDKMNLTLAVADQGMGVPANQKNRLFTKFFRGSNAIKMETEGTGLGLFLSKNIVERHGGKIWAETEENKGSTFYLTLPLSKKTNNTKKAIG